MKSKILANHRALQHELRSPLTTILGMITFLNESPLTVSQRAYVDYISHSANQLLNMANDISAGAYPLDDVSFSDYQTEATSETPYILVVEDDPLVQLIYKEILLEIGCELDFAENGQQALMKINNGYDLILLDVSLPDMSGIDIAQEIRQRDDQWQQPQIIVITSHTEESIRNACFNAGVDRVLTKPIDAETLLGIIQPQAVEL